MARSNVLFMIHGIGEHADGWSDGPIGVLNEAAKQYGVFTGKDGPLRDQIEFVEIRYDDIFDGLLENFEALANEFDAVKSTALPDPVKKLKKVLGNLNGTSEKYLGDVVLYKGFALVQRAVLLQVMSQIANTVAEVGLEHEGTPVKYGVLAHSMGTTVAHDALHHLATTQWIEPEVLLQNVSASDSDLANGLIDKVHARVGTNPFSPENFRFDSIFMISNTSRLLHTTDKNPYQSAVRPVSSSNGEGVCGSFYNIDHKLDPVSKVKRFRVFDAWRSDNEGGMDIEVDHFYNRNVHGLEHYLLHPYVHGSILGHLAPDFSPGDWDDAWNRVYGDSFAQWGNEFDTAVIKNKLQRKLRSMMPSTIGQETMDKWVKIQQDLEALKALL
ncbi:MAG: hypothetical protein KAU29_09545 [Gammaproteobacteria bacterium]|nr:hypothetical protein [Gammaproteobacteria bacterium]